MDKVNVYIDGFNPYYGALKGTPYKWLDWGAFAKLSFPQTPFKKSNISQQG